MTTRDQEQQDLGIELMSAQLDQIRWEMEQARIAANDRQTTHQEEMAREQRRFVIQTIVTSIAGVTAAVALILHLMGKV